MPIPSKITKTMYHEENVSTHPPRSGEITGAMPLMAPMIAMTDASVFPDEALGAGAAGATGSGCDAGFALSRSWQ